MAARKPSPEERRPPIKDEPGAEERFKGILKRALNTPPKRKRIEPKRAAAKSKRGGGE